MVARPSLPVRYANPNIKDHLKAPNLPPVKYQILNCQGKDILVGRLKIETPTDTGHAFILRRFDTGAISLTTMFRAAFPNASDSDERQEIQWVRDTYDLSGNNGSTKDAHITRLAGTWVSPSVALELGKAYALNEIIEAVVQATPDPNGNYRRSGKAAANATPTQPTITPAKGISPTESTFSALSTTAVVEGPTSVVVSKPPSAARSLPTPSPTANIPPSKRRKESSPAPTSQSSKPPSSRASPAPSKAATPRRSARTKSPAPRSAAATTVMRTPKATRSSVRKEIVATTSVTLGDSELTVVEEESQLVEDGVAGSELHDEDIREQQKLIQDLKSKREAAKAAVEPVQMDVSEGSSLGSKKKREREEEEPEFRFEFRESETQERPIATNRRVGRFHLEPRAKSFAWGLAAFAVGMGAAYLPAFF
ncbi:hypothetical protein BDN70DRAFT_883763 [Pholiota conissans]|uniref:HTH APSES-type domain-containing protein n=1 Tax=Pholiota conissans TaxID=109636 RepID=A0A9P5YVD3_9AGAR|nr:hypothetical protein BDN70DRAFT_883763 [Pholiota conissans]